VIRYDSGAALIVVDVQNDFADRKGSLSVREGSRVVPVANRHVRRARDSGAIVVYTQDWHPPHTPHFAQDGGIWPVHCVQFTWGAEFYPSLVVDGPTVRKGSNGEDGYSGFTMRDPLSGETVPTELEDVLRKAGIERIVICGLATDYCVKATALDGVRLGFGTTVLTNGVRAVELAAGDGRRALGEMAASGVGLEPPPA
jgi:nicotinamidase/pyrazinamidase